MIKKFLIDYFLLHCDDGCDCGCGCNNGSRTVYVRTLTGITGPRGATDRKSVV